MLSSGNELHLSVAVKNQYIYKLRSYSGYFCALVLLQVIGALFSLSGSMTTGDSVGNINITFHSMSAQITVIFTECWAFVISVLLATHTSKDAAFTVVGNRLSDCLSDMAFILTGCVFGGISAALFGVAMRVPICFIYAGRVMAKGFYPTLGTVCTIAVATMLYMLLLSSAGYLAAVLVRLHKVFIVIYPAILIGTILIVKNSEKSQTFLRICWDSIIKEKSLGIFALRVVIISAIVLAIGTVISNRMEVKK